MFRSSEDKRSDESGASLERLAGRIQVLGERVDTLAQTVATTAAAIAKKDGELAIIRRDLEQSDTSLRAALSERRPAASDDVHDLRQQMAALSAEQGRSSEDSRVSKLEGKIALLTERVDTLGTTVATTAAGLAGRDGDIVALRRRVEQLTSAPGGGPAMDDAFRERIDDLGAATAAASMRIESQAEQISALRDTLVALVGRLDRAEEDRAALATSIGEAAAARWSDLERMLASLAGRLDALEGALQQHDAALARASSLWPAALRSLEERVRELARRPAAAGDEPLSIHRPEDTRGTDVSRFLSEIRSLERRLAESEAHARHEREELTARLRRLESDHLPTDAPVASAGGDVLPFRGSET